MDAVKGVDARGATLADACGGSCDVGLDGLEGSLCDEAGAEGTSDGAEALEGALAGLTSEDVLGVGVDGTSDGGRA